LGQAVTLSIDTLRLQSTLPALRPELESGED
jgi:hypothetical protein